MLIFRMRNYQKLKINPDTKFDFSSIGGLLATNTGNTGNTGNQHSLIVVSLSMLLSLLSASLITFLKSLFLSLVDFYGNPDNFHEPQIQLVVMLKVLIGRYHHHHGKEVVSNERVIHTYHLLTRPSSQHTS